MIMVIPNIKMYTYWNNTENPPGLLRQHSGAAQNKTKQQLNKCTCNHCLCAALGREEKCECSVIETLRS